VGGGQAGGQIAGLELGLNFFGAAALIWLSAVGDRFYEAKAAATSRSPGMQTWSTSRGDGRQTLTTGAHTRPGAQAAFSVDPAGGVGGVRGGSACALPRLDSFHLSPAVLAAFQLVDCRSLAHHSRRAR
jgi:hypothetical protein